MDSPQMLLIWTEPARFVLRAFGPEGIFPETECALVVRSAAACSQRIADALTGAQARTDSARHYTVAMIGVDRSGALVVTRVYSRVDCDPDAARGRDDILADLYALAVTLGSSALAAEAARISALAPNATRAIRIALLDGTVHAGPRRVALTLRELEILSAIAIGRRSVATETILELVWPDFDVERARRSLKVYAHRIRARLEDSRLLKLRLGRWHLCSSVAVDLHEYDVLIASAERTGLTASSRNELAQAERLLAAGYPEVLSTSRVCADLDRTIKELRGRAAGLLVRDAFERKDPARALALARELTMADPYAEPWNEAIVRALIMLDDEVSARRHIRAYEDLLRHDLGLTSPSRIVQLVESSRSVAV